MSRKEVVVIEIGEFCNKIVTDDSGTKLHFDKCLLDDVIEMLEGLRDE